jgi:ribose 5-phosphate isomerase A
MPATTTEGLKRRAAEHALAYVEPGMVLGLGTGSTVAHFTELLGDALRSGELSDIVCVPTSERTERAARAAGIELVGLGDRPSLDLAIDGADEVSPDVDLIKGMGGALLREKMVAQASQRFVVIADAGKRVERLGTRSPLPLEVVEWGIQAHVRFLRALGADVEVRSGRGGKPVRSDNGNLFLECRFPGGIEDPLGLERMLAGRAGVVETGLFLGLASEAVIAGEDGVRVLRREP